MGFRLSSTLGLPGLPGLLGLPATHRGASWEETHVLRFPHNHIKLASWGPGPQTTLVTHYSKYRDVRCRAWLVTCLPLQTWEPEFLSAAATYKAGMVGHTWSPNAESGERSKGGWRQAEPWGITGQPPRHQWTLVQWEITTSKSRGGAWLRKIPKVHLCHTNTHTHTKHAQAYKINYKRQRPCVGALVREHCHLWLNTGHGLGRPCYKQRILELFKMLPSFCPWILSFLLLGYT